MSVMSTLEALEAIREPEGVKLWRCPPLWYPEGLTVTVAAVIGSAGIEGRGETRHQFLPVSLDAAHDLSWRGPEAWVWPDAGDMRGVIRWSVYALGFIEDEAREAFEAVRAAVNALQVPSGPNGI